MDLSFSSELRTNEKYGILWKTFWVWYSYSHFHKQGTLSYITKKTVLPKKGVLLDLKTNDFGWKSGVLFVQNPRKWGVVQTWVRPWYMLGPGVVVGGVGGGWGGWGGGGVGGGGGGGGVSPGLVLVASVTFSMCSWNQIAIYHVLYSFRNLTLVWLWISGRLAAMLNFLVSGISLCFGYEYQAQSTGAYHLSVWVETYQFFSDATFRISPRQQYFQIRR